MAKMKSTEIDSALVSVPAWKKKRATITRTYQFKDFLESMKFVNAVAALAEKRQHHPDVLIRWNKVTLSLSTHDSGGITQKDFDLAGECEQIRV